MRLHWGHWTGALLLVLLVEAGAVWMWNQSIDKPSTTGRPIETQVNLRLSAIAPGAVPASPAKAKPPKAKPPKAKPPKAKPPKAKPPKIRRVTASPAKVQTPAPSQATELKTAEGSATEAVRQPESVVRTNVKPPASSGASVHAPEIRSVDRVPSSAKPIITDDQGLQKKYQAQLIAWLLKFKRYPDKARQRGMTGTVAVQFEITAAGQLVSHRLSLSSGYAVLDRAALAMLERATPLPSVPAGYGPAPYRFTVPLEFELQ